MFKYLISVICFVSLSQGADILAIVPTPSYSHQVAFIALWKELSFRGHKVTVITTDPVNDPTLRNLTEIDIKWAYKHFTNISRIAEDKMNMWNALPILFNLVLGVVDELFSYSPFEELVRGGRNFDVVLVETWYPELLFFAEIYKCPKILISSMDVLIDTHTALGNPSHPAINLEVATHFNPPLSFQERVLSTIHKFYFSYFLAYEVHPSKEKNVQKYLNTSINIDEMVRGVDMMFLNVNPVVETVRAIGPTTINIGGFRETTQSKPLPKDIKEFLDNAVNGFIYFSLGSNIKSKELAGPTFNAIFETLKDIPYKVLWKFEAGELPGKPDNIKLVKWVPQQKVLSHPNIKLFVTQGGLQSMEEGIHSEVPFVVIPFFGDQIHNAKLMKSKGIAEIVNRKPSVKKEELKDAILQVIRNPSYKKAVKRLKQLMLDAPMSGLQKAVWWTEYVIRNKGAKHLRNPIVDLPFYQYHLLDVISFLALITVSVIWAVIKLTKILYRLISHILVDKVLLKIKKQQ